MPRCTSVGRVLKASSPAEGVSLFVAAGWEAVGAIFTESYVSLVSSSTHDVASLLDLLRAGTAEVAAVHPNS